MIPDASTKSKESSGDASSDGFTNIAETLPESRSPALPLADECRHDITISISMEDDTKNESGAQKMERQLDTTAQIQSDEEDFLQELAMHQEIISQINDNVKKGEGLTLPVLKKALRNLIDFLKRGPREVSSSSSSNERCLDFRYVGVARGFLLQLMQLESNEEEMKELQEEFKMLCAFSAGPAGPAAAVDKTPDCTVAKIEPDSTTASSGRWWPSGFSLWRTSSSKEDADTDLSKPDHRDLSKPDHRDLSKLDKGFSFSDWHDRHLYVSFRMGQDLAYVVDSLAEKATHGAATSANLVVDVSKHAGHFAVDIAGQCVLLPILRNTPLVRDLSNEVHLATTIFMTDCGHSVVSASHSVASASVDRSKEFSRAATRTVIHVVVLFVTVAATSALAKLADIVGDLMYYCATSAATATGLKGLPAPKPMSALMDSKEAGDRPQEID